MGYLVSASNSTLSIVLLCMDSPLSKCGSFPLVAAASILQFVVALHLWDLALKHVGRICLIQVGLPKWIR